MSECLDANVAMGLADNSLSANERESAQAHIAECATCRRLVAELLRSEDGEDDGEDDDEDDGLPALGEQVGRYELRGFRGRGGMGAVYDAYDPKLDRLVALKLVRPTDGGSGSGGRGRLLREAHALAKLAHPNVVSVFDVGDFGDQIYIAMELVEGVTLRAWLAAGSRTDVEVLATFRDAGRGLAAAHERGMVHRDFKPDNVLVGDDGRVRVVDFGLVRAAGSHDEDTSVSRLSPVDEKTRTGTVVGTPAYMAPEQLGAGSIDQRADQFSFAVALYEALYGQRPFGGETLGEVAKAIAAGDVREPATGSSVPRHVRTALLRSLSAAPADRFERLDELLEALQPRSRRWPQLLALGLGAALIGSVVVARTIDRGESPCTNSDELAAAIWNESRASAASSNISSSAHPGELDAFKRIRDRMEGYRTEWRAIHEKACRATHVDKTQPEARFERQLICLFDRLERSRAIGERLEATLTIKDVDDIVAATRRLPPIQSCDRVDEGRGAPLPPAESKAAVREVRAAISRARELDMAGASDSLPIGQDIHSRAKAIGFAPLTAEALYLLGQIHASRAENVVAERILREAVPLAAEASYDSLLAALWVDIIETLYEQGKYTDAIALAPVADAAMTRANADARLRARGLRVIGEAHWWKPDYEKALAMMREAAELLEKSYGDEDADLPIALALLAEALVDNGRAAEALEVAQRSAVLAERAFGLEHTKSGWARAIVGMSLRALERHAEAKPVLVEALERLVRLAGDHPDIIWIRRELGLVLHGLGDFEQAALAHQRAATATATAYGEKDYRVSLHLKNVARADLAQGKHDKARESLERALAIRIASRGSTHGTTGEIHLRLGELARAEGKLDEALEALERAETIYRGDEDLGSIGMVHGARARLLWGFPARRKQAIEEANAALRAFVFSGDAEGAAEVREWLADKR